MPILLMPLAMAAAFSIVSAGAVSPAVGPQVAADAPYPPMQQFARRVRDALRAGDALLAQYTYLEHRRDVRISRLGKVSVGPLRTFEVYPGEGTEGRYKRLIAVEGEPLDAAELARRDRRRAREREAAERRRAQEAAGHRAEREARELEEMREHEAVVADAFAVFAPSFAGRDRIDGRSMLVVDLQPRPEARVSTRQGGWMKQFAGRMWVDEGSYQIVRLEMRAIDDISIGWGVVGRIHQGSRIHYSRRRVGDAWLPARLEYAGSGRTLLFRSFDVSARTTYTDYRKLQPDEGSGPAADDPRAAR